MESKYTQIKRRNVPSRGWAKFIVIKIMVTMNSKVMDAYYELLDCVPSPIETSKVLLNNSDDLLQIPESIVDSWGKDDNIIIDYVLGELDLYREDV